MEIYIRLVTNNFPMAHVLAIEGKKETFLKSCLKQFQNRDETTQEMFEGLV